jgi:hypothetical protein
MLVSCSEGLAMSRTRGPSGLLLCVATAALTLSNNGFSQDAKAKSESSPVPKFPTILHVRSMNEADDATTVVRLNQSLVLTLKDDGNWIGTTQLKNIVLFLNSRPLPKLPVRLLLKNDKQQTKAALEKELIFDLQRNKDNKDAWDLLIGDFHFWEHFEKFNGKEISVALGSDSTAVAEAETKILFVPHSPGIWLLGALGIPLGFLAVFVYKVWYDDWFSNIVRDKSVQPRPGKVRPFSLGRCQMAFWFFLVLISANFIWWFTGDIASMIFPTSILALMGISSLTTLSAVGVETSIPNARIDALKNTLLPGTQLKAIEVTPQDNWTDEQRTKWAEVVKEYDQLTATQGLWHDLLCGPDGPALHRMQMLAWTLVLAVVFVFTVLHDLKMPDFDASLLLLMGITNFTYVGFKVPENRGPAQAH